MAPHRSRSVALLAALLPLGSGAYQCESDIIFKATSTLAKKGLALDDTTFSSCASRIPWLWPNTRQPVTSLRLFKAWSPDWDEEARQIAWEDLVTFATVSNATILLGTQVTCDKQADDQDWAWATGLLKLLAPEQVMGIAIGNELDILKDKASVDETVTPDCIQSLWDDGGFWSLFQSRIAELDATGFSRVPVTTVFTGAALGGSPFVEAKGATVNTFLTAASKKYGHRFAFTFNFYPYFDPNYQLNRDGGCATALATAACFGGSCQTPSSVALARQKIQQVSGDAKTTFWVGETGWSSPGAKSLHTAMANCSAWSSPSVFQKYYSGFLEWNLDGAGADHIFYFDIRDSYQFGVAESFGLIESCKAEACKIRSANFSARPSDYTEPRKTPEWPWYSWLWVGLGGVLLVIIFSTCVAVWSRRWCGTAREPLPVHRDDGSVSPVDRDEGASSSVA